MKVLIAEDDRVSRRLLVSTVEAFGHDTTAVEDGTEAWQAVSSETFDVLISDWNMPGMDGPDLCTRLREDAARPYCYVLLLTTRHAKADVVAGMMAGADDFMTKPFDRDVLQARLHAADRVVLLHRKLARRVEELSRALHEVKTLRGLLPICMYCKSIQSSTEAWERIEAYVTEHSDAEFTHSICPSCYEEHVEPQLDALRKKKSEQTERADTP